MILKDTIGIGYLLSLKEKSTKVWETIFKSLHL